MFTTGGTSMEIPPQLQQPFFSIGGKADSGADRTTRQRRHTEKVHALLLSLEERERARRAQEEEARAEHERENVTLEMHEYVNEKYFNIFSALCVALALVFLIYTILVK